jgi:2-methoxy-6-polyprenyl-1,4-benzoquinol methylase
MATKLAWRPLLRSAKLKPASLQAQPSFSSSVRQAQDTSKAQSSNHERYTHFGYENVKEEEKASKGMLSLRNI